MRGGGIVEMNYLQDIVLVLHVLAAISIIAVVMLQHGKGADMGAGFGAGASATVFGASGSGNFLTKTTTVAATIFFVTSFSLAYFAKERAADASQVGMPTATVQQAPVQGDEVNPALPMAEEEMPQPESDQAAPAPDAATAQKGDPGDEELPDL